MRIIVKDSHFARDAFDNGVEYVKKTDSHIVAYPLDFDCIIRTFQGDMKAKKGDYFVIGACNEIYCINKKIFESTYEVF